MRYRTTRQADDDIIGLYMEGYRKFGRRHAERYHAGLAATFALLAAHPNLSRERPEFDPPIRLHPYHAHLIVFRLTEDAVLIVRVLHARQNWQELV
jgi:toxin ParE1/3/4